MGTTIAVVTATRAEYGLLLPVIRALRKRESDALRVELIVTGTHLSEAYGKTIRDIEADGTRIDRQIPIPVASSSPEDISSNQAETLRRFTELFARQAYGGVILLGDRYETLAVDVTGDDPLLAIHTQLPDDSVRNIYRITLTGELDEAPDLSRLRQNLSELFFELQLRDETRLRHGVWDFAGEDTLRGLFLRRLKVRFDAAQTEEERVKLEQAARWGLAALDNAEEVAQHEDQ